MLVGVGFLMQYNKLMDERSKIDTIKQTENTLDNIRGNPGFFMKIVNFPVRRKLEFDCDIIIVDGRPFKWDKIIFAPKKIESGAVVVAHVLVDPGVDVYYVFDANKKPYVNDLDSVIEEDFNFYVVNNPSVGLEVSDGLIHFEDGSVSYLSEWDAVGAAVVSDKGKFECLQKKILVESLDILEIQKKKAKLLSLKTECDYGLVIASLEKLENYAIKGEVSKYSRELEILENKQKQLGACPDVR